ncbi:MAG: integrase arm-type DNA-binding domain-containing protein [Holophagaceae bacterium]|nr:integrase arm-type DNA-binding domain-containing protein [Holophagaceae bacterium]
MLTDLAAKNSRPREKVYNLTDQHGLYLRIEPAGGKYWRYKYWFGGKQKVVALGVYPDTTLDAARNQHKEARELLKNGIDPGEAKKAKKRRLGMESAATFRAIAEVWFRKWSANKAHATAKRNWERLENHAFPLIGLVQVSDIKPPDVLYVCQEIEKKGLRETSHKVKSLVSHVLRFGVSLGLVERDATTDLRGALEEKTTIHRPAIIDPQKFGKLLRDVDSYHGSAVVRAASRLAPLVFVRPGELRQARWADIDLAKAQWTLLLSKQKKGGTRELIVPLAKQAVAILKGLQGKTGGGDYCFPSKGGKPISDMALNKALSILGYDTSTEHCTHGWRASARTLIAEQLKFDPTLIERQLGHLTSEALREAYDRTMYLVERTKMMQAWADYLDGLKAKK